MPDEKIIEVNQTEANVSAGKLIWTKIHEVMKEVTHIQKEKKPGIPYEFVSHDAVVSKIRASFIKHGIVCKQDVTRHQFTVQKNSKGNDYFLTVVDTNVYLVNKDDASDCVCINSFGYGIDTTDKGPGKAMSYAFKYALLKTFLFETGDDPDVDPDPTGSLPPPPKEFASTDVYKGTNDHKKFLWDKFKAKEVTDPNVVKDFAEFLNGKTFATVDDFFEIVTTNNVPVSRLPMLCKEIKDKKADEIEQIVITFYKMENK